MEAHRSPELCVAATELRRSLSRLNRLLAAGRPRGELSSAKFTTLGILRRSGPMSASALAARQGIRPQSLTRLLAELEADGLIIRGADPDDGRQSIVRPTAKATAVMRAEGERRDAVLSEVMQRTLSNVEIEFLQFTAKTLNKLADGWSDAAALAPEGAAGGQR
jgi:DNA-binding MarR family transcriptional regulator